MNSVKDHSVGTVREAGQFDVSVLGLGAMGARMAQTLIKQGKRVAIWNRSPAKAEALRDAGAHSCETAEAAILASPVTILVLLDQNAVNDVFDQVDQGRAFEGRTIVNFTTNSRDESLRLARLVEEGGGRFVKGTIVAYPRNIGHPETFAIYSGDPLAVSGCSDVLKLIAPNEIILPLDEAYAFSVTLHSFMFSAMAAFYEAVRASEHFGQAPAETAKLIRKVSEYFVSDALHDAVRRLEIGDFSGDQAKLDVHASAFENLAKANHMNGAQIPIFEAVCRTIQGAQAMGLGDQDIVAMTEALNSPVSLNC